MSVELMFSYSLMLTMLMTKRPMRTTSGASKSPFFRSELERIIPYDHHHRNHPQR
jgi:hypothetical protein